MPYVAGFHTGRDDSTSFAPNLAVLSFAKDYIRLMPGGMGKLTAILDIMGAGQAQNIEHFWYTKTMVNAEGVATATVAGTPAQGSSATLTMSAAHVARFTVGMTIQNLTTSEQMLITAVASATTLTVLRGVGTSATAAITTGDVFAAVGTAFEEGSNRPIAAAISPVRVGNHTQVFRNAWALTDTMKNIMTIAGDGNFAENKRDCMEFHMRDQEAAIIFGERLAPGVVSLNGSPFHKMDGIVNAVKTLAPANVFTAGATTTYTTLLSYLDPCFNVQTDPRIGNERLLLVGSQAVNVLHQIARLNSQYHIVNEPSSSGQNFGINFLTFTTPRGKFKLMEHPIMNFHSAWSKMAIAVDISQWRKMYLGDRKLKAEEFSANDKSGSLGVDAAGGSVTSEFTLEYKNPASSVVIYNLTAGAAG